MRFRHSIYFAYLMIIVFLFIIHCGNNIINYYPLTEGIKWEYQRFWNYNWTNGTKVKTIMTNLAPRDIEGIKVFPQTWDTDVSTSLFFVTQNDSGIFIFATQIGTDDKPQIKKVREYFLKNPIKVGTSWEINDEYYFYTSGHKRPALFKYMIVSLDDVVTVPAGIYSNCLKLRVECMVSDYIKNIGSVNIYFHGFKWYAPGVGFVKSNWTEEIYNYIRKVDKNLKLEYSCQLLSIEK